MEPGRLIASGRDADIFEFGPGLVLRRTHGRRSLAREFRTMAYAAEHGYPVPAVHELRSADTEIVMERVPGPIMVDVILKRPWTLGQAARTLADLHDQLHVIPAPHWLPQLPDAGGQLVHLDLHPLNVIVHAERGPVVIDWANASRGEGLSDVALTYVLLTCPRMPGPAVLRAAVKPLRALLAREFTRRYRGPALDARIAAAAELKAMDTNISPDEAAAMHALAARRADERSSYLRRSRRTRAAREP
jgi:aminoglycoside phosphotransferase (APT) family kinase protein